MKKKINKQALLRLVGFLSTLIGFFLAILDEVPNMRTIIGFCFLYVGFLICLLTMKGGNKRVH